MKKVNIIFKIIIYYCLLFSGLLIISLIFYNKFIRERITKNIPIFLSEYGFWALSYLCIIYIFIIVIIILSLVNFQKKKNPNESIFKKIIEIIYIPLKTLDHFIKYNKYFKHYYCKVMFYIIKHLQKLKIKHLIFIIIIFQLIPRIILGITLLIDTFYFHKLELFYKVIVIGILPFLFRYLKYCIKDNEEYYTHVLETKYEEILLHDKASIETKNEEWELTEDNKFHNQKMKTKDYIAFKLQCILKIETQTWYMENPIVFDHIFKQYVKNKDISKLEEADFENLRKDFFDIMPIIIDLALFYEKLSYIQIKKPILWCRLIIFSNYLLCWSYILIVSYYHYPIELFMFKYFLFNFFLYLEEFDDPFSSPNKCSRNENLITIKNILRLLKHIFNKIFKIK